MEFYMALALNIEIQFSNILLYVWDKVFSVYGRIIV